MLLWRREVDVEVTEGSAPLVISVPHDGEEDLPGAGLRTSWRRRDVGTHAVASLVGEEFLRLTGEAPTIVSATIHRKWIDFNRPARLAYDQPRWVGWPPYRRFHGQLRRAVRRVGRHGLLLDLHGHGLDDAHLHFGTAGITGLHGLRLALRLATGLATHGYQVGPLYGRERFPGGYIVRSFEGRVTPIQLEVTRLLREPGEVRDRFAIRLATHLAEVGGRGDGVDGGTSATKANPQLGMTLEPSMSK